MFTANGVLKIVDFGISKIMIPASKIKNNTCVGTPSYSAPQILDGQLKSGR